MKRHASIAGGGPAGLACGLELLARGWEVTVYEKGRYPLKKVCGEFLSPAGKGILDRLGIHLPDSAPVIEWGRFYYRDTKHFDMAFHPPARGISRAWLDTALAGRFRSQGGRLLEGRSLNPAQVDSGSVAVDTRGRPLSGGPWTGWKAVLNPDSIPAGMNPAHLHMMLLKGGYCGLSPVENGRLTLCLIARGVSNVNELLAGNAMTRDLAAKARPVASIHGFEIGPQPGAGPRAGDRLSVWPPVVGDGISVALQSGITLARHLDSDKPLPSPPSTGLAVALHRAMTSPRLLSLAGPLLKLAGPQTTGYLYRATRRA